MVLPGQGQPRGGHGDRDGRSAASLGDQEVCQSFCRANRCLWRTGQGVCAERQGRDPLYATRAVGGGSGEFYRAGMDGVKGKVDRFDGLAYNLTWLA